MATSTQHQDKLTLLRDILLPEEHKALEELSERILRMERQEVQQNELLRKLESDLNCKIEEGQKELRKSLREDLLTVLRTEIEKDPEAMASILEPLTPSLLDRQRSKSKKARREKRSAPGQSFRRSWEAFTGFFNKTHSLKKAEKQLKSAVIVQTFIIDRKSRNLKASFTENEMMDESKISVTCGVINDQIQKLRLGQDQHMAVLPYGPYQIYVQGFIKHFVALVISGRKEMECRDRIQDVIFSFYYEFLSKHLDLLNEGNEEKVAKKSIDRTFLDKVMEKISTKDPLTTDK